MTEYTFDPNALADMLYGTEQSPETEPLQDAGVPEPGFPTIETYDAPGNPDTPIGMPAPDIGEGEPQAGTPYPGDDGLSEQDLRDLTDNVGAPLRFDENGDLVGTLNNGAKVRHGIFAAISEEDEFRALADALYNGNTMVVDGDGVIHTDSHVSPVNNGTGIKDGIFAGTAEELDDLSQAIYGGNIRMDEDGVPRPAEDQTPQPNGTAFRKGDFAAPSLNVMAQNMVQRPKGFRDQWYWKKPTLYFTEVSAMMERFPHARMGFFQSNGNMYWTVELKITKTGEKKPWAFMLVYDKNHPNNISYGGSIKVFPVRPNVEDLRRIAKSYGRPGVPHILSDPSRGSYLCTRRSEDVESGTSTVSGAVEVTAWAADWATHFEVGMRDKRVWNKWCDDQHFRRLMI